MERPRDSKCSATPTALRGAEQFVLPDCDHGPAECVEVASVSNVSRTIRAQLHRPVAAIARRHGEALRASVPEAPVDEDCDLLPTEREVGSPGQRLVPSPAANTGHPERSGESELRARIARGSYPRHVPRALLAGEQISHATPRASTWYAVHARAMPTPRRVHGRSGTDCDWLQPVTTSAEVGTPAPVSARKICRATAQATGGGKAFPT